MKKKSLSVVLFIVSIGLFCAPLLFKNILHSMQALGIAGIFLINFLGSATLFLPVPGIVSVAIGGSLYNPILVALAASFGSCLGEGVGFLFGYSSKQVFLLEKNKTLSYLLSYTFKSWFGVVVIFLFSAIPNPVFDGIGILAGISGLSLNRFLLIVFLGRLVRNLFIASFGHAL